MRGYIYIYICIYIVCVFIHVDMILAINSPVAYNVLVGAGPPNPCDVSGGPGLAQFQDGIVRYITIRH